MQSEKYLKLLVEEIHSAVVATIGADSHPQTRMIDMMLWDEKGVYFLTAKGKAFYSQLMEQKYIALSATKDKKSVSLRGKVQNIGSEKLDERRIYLIKALLSEEAQYRDMEIPSDEQQQKLLLRALFNVWMPKPVSNQFLEVQDAYLQEATRQKGITDLSELTPVQDSIYLWQGDITSLHCGAIVNAANLSMLGCFYPNHGCIDNAIHTYAGIQLRAACSEFMERQGHEEETGKAKITPAFNLPCDYVIHTVGPIVRGWLTGKDKELLGSCYRSCLELAEQNNIKSIAFCCISTGEFHFPNDKAAQVAVSTVKQYKEQTNSEIKVIFNVFKDTDLQIYQNLLQ